MAVGDRWWPLAGSSRGGSLRQPVAGTSAKVPGLLRSVCTGTCVEINIPHLLGQLRGGRVACWSKLKAPLGNLGGKIPSETGSCFKIRAWKLVAACTP